MDDLVEFPQYGTGRRYAPDRRDRLFSVQRTSIFERAVIRYPKVFYRTARPLDQGQTDECVEFAWQLFLTAFPRMTQPLPRRKIYDYAQAHDEWDSTPPEGGTSVRAGAKALQSFGLLKSYVWATTAAEARIWLQAGGGTIVMGTDWYNTMFRPTVDGRLIVPRNQNASAGHAWLIVGYDPAHAFRDGVFPAFRMQNSWGPSWGEGGRAWVLENDLDYLIQSYGEACCGVEQELKAAA